MANGNPKMVVEASEKQPPSDAQAVHSLHPAWSAFVRCCRELQHGEIDCLKIQDGLPVLAEVTKKKVKFA
jgi:hypothetical protein